MELVPGGTLAKRLKEGPVTARFAIRVGAEIAAGLAAAHETGLVHQDVKPANVMLPPTGAKVVDFGFAAAIAPSGSGTPAAEVFGTPAYLAPERLTDDAVEPASDVYALGVVLYGMLSGESPWTVESTTQMLNAHLYIDPIPLGPQPGVPDEVVDLCNRCLAKDPADRPSARSVAAVLTRHLAAPEPEPEPEPVSASRSARRRLAAAVLLVLAGLAGWLAFRGNQQGPEAGDPAVAGPRNSASALPPSHTAGPAPTRTHDGRTEPSLTAAPGLTTPGRTAPAVIGTVTPTAAPPTPSTTETTTPEPKERTFSSLAGTVTATCPSAGTARIVSWQATKPYRVESADPGPAAEPAVTFKRGKALTTITVTCTASTPSATVAES
jgi:serine/threonine-protein kinase